MAIDKILGNSALDQVADSVFSAVSDSVSEIKAMQKRKAAENVQIVVQALKKIESDLQDKYDGVTTVIEKRVASIKDGKDGQNGVNGRDGKDGRPGRDGSVGPRGANGVDGRPGRDGVDGVSVTNAFIDFDGSLVINLSDGQSLNVGEVVAPDLAEKIKVITNGGGTSQGVLDTLTSLQNQINALVNMGSVNYVGTWNASTNTPTIVASTGDKGDYYVVSVAGSTSINGQTLWGVGDWIIFNGSVWQRVDGGSTGNFTTLDVSGAVTLSGGTANGVAYLNGSKVLTTGSALTFNGTSLKNSASSSGATPSGNGNQLVLESSGNAGLTIATGASSLGNIFFADSGDSADGFVQYDQSGRSMRFGTATAERMRLDSSGNLGLGVTPSAWRSTYRAFDVGTRSAFTDDDGPRIWGNAFENSAGTSIYKATGPATQYYAKAGFHAWFVAPSGTAGNAISFTQAMTLDASGNLQLGTTSALSAASGRTDLTINGSSIGAIISFGNGGVRRGYIWQDGTDLYFANQSNGNAIFITNNTERARITSGGDLLVGTTSTPNGGSVFYVAGGGTILTTQTTVSTACNHIVFRNSNGNVGNIQTSGTATAFNTSSDYRLKNITGPITTSGAYIDSLNPVEGTWKADGSTFVGLIAHEVQEASRTTVATGVKDGEEMQGMDYSSAELIANMLAELKSLRARVAALEAV